MRPLTPAERAILEAFEGRTLFCTQDAAQVFHSVNERRHWAVTMLMRDDGLIKDLGMPRDIRMVVKDGKRQPKWRSTVATRLYRVTAKGRRALREGGTR